jgi:hypothetical protein
MAFTTVSTATVIGVVVEKSGVPSDITLLIANTSFLLVCYLTTLAFEDLLYLPSLETLLNAYAKKQIDVVELFDDRTPATFALGERIWGHKPISRCVLIKTYATDTKALYDKIVSQLLAALLVVLIVSASVSLVGRDPMSIGAAGPASGITISLVTLMVTFAFAVIRVYWPLFELAQRNHNLVREAEPQIVAS